MRKDFTEIKESIEVRPAGVFNGRKMPKDTVRTLSLGQLRVIARSSANGYDVNIERGSEPQPWIAADEWNAFKIMVESQFLWSRAQGGGKP